MADHHEGVLALVHEQMSAPAGHGEHGGTSDPVAFDSYLDAEKREMLSLLSTLYGDNYSPRPVLTLVTDSTGVHRTYQEKVARAFREGIALVDAVRGSLRRPAVRTLADKLRHSEFARLREVDAEAPVTERH